MQARAGELLPKNLSVLEERAGKKKQGQPEPVKSSTEHGYLKQCRPNLGAAFPLSFWASFRKFTSRLLSPPSFPRFSPRFPLSLRHAGKCEHQTFLRSLAITQPWSICFEGNYTVVFVLLVRRDISHVRHLRLARETFLRLVSCISTQGRVPLSKPEIQ